MSAERTSTTSSLKPEGEYHRGLVRACPCVIWNGDYNYKSIPSRDWLIAAGELTANHANIRFAGIPSSSEVLGIFEHAIGDDHAPQSRAGLEQGVLHGHASQAPFLERVRGRKAGDSAADDGNTFGHSEVSSNNQQLALNLSN